MDGRNQAALWSEPELAGYLDKCQEPSKCWKKRLFLLQGHCLFYFRDEQQVKTMAPSGLIPVEGSSVASMDETSARRFAFYISVGPKYAGAAKRDTYVLAADSPEALEAWLRMLKVASYPRDVLFAKLRRTRYRADELRSFLSGSFADKQLLASAEGSEGRELRKRRTRASKDKSELAAALETAVLKADKQEAAVAQATLLWNIVSNVVDGSRPSVSAALEHEIQLIKKLYKLLEVKANLYQGQGVEDLNNASRLQLQASLASAIDLIQERHAMIRARSSRFSFLVDPSIYDQERLLEQASTTLSAEGRQAEKLNWPPRDEKPSKMRRPPKLDGSKRKLKSSKCSKSKSFVDPEEHRSSLRAKASAHPL